MPLSTLVPGSKLPVVLKVHVPDGSGGESITMLPLTELLGDIFNVIAAFTVVAPIVVTMVPPRPVPFCENVAVDEPLPSPESVSVPL